MTDRELAIEILRRILAGPSQSFVINIEHGGMLGQICIAAQVVPMSEVESGGPDVHN